MFEESKIWHFRFWKLLGMFVARLINPWYNGCMAGRRLYGAYYFDIRNYFIDTEIRYSIK